MMHKPLLSALFALSVATSAQATIHYRDLQHTYISATNRHVQVDVDFDGSNDYEFDVTTLQNARNCTVAAMTPDQYFLVTASTYAPVGLQSGQGLGGSNNLYSNANRTAVSMASSMNGGQFENATRYLMIRFVTNGITHYGWIYLAASSNTPDITLYGCAYSDVADETVLPGQGNPTAVPAIGAAPDFRYALSRTGFSVGSIGADSKVAVLITDVTGRKVFQQTFEQTGDNGLRLPTGLYLVYAMDLKKRAMIVADKVALID